MFKQLILLLTFLAISPAALAQNAMCPDRPVSDSSNACANTRFVKSYIPSLPVIPQAFYPTRAAMVAASIPAGTTYIQVDEVVTGSGCPVQYKVNNSPTGLFGEVSITVGGVPEYGTPIYDKYNLNLCQIGVVGNDVSDDGATITSAVASLYGDISTGIMSQAAVITGLPDRIYKFGTTVTVGQQNITFDCQGARIDLQAAIAFNWTQPAYTWWAQSGAVKNCRITGTSTTASTQVGIQGLANNFFVAENNEITAVGVGLSLCAVRPVIRDNYIHDNADRGLVLTSCYIAPGSFTATGQSGSNVTVANVSTPYPIRLGALVTGTNIPASTTVTAINTGTNTITLSNAPTGSVGAFQVQNPAEAQSAVVVGNNRFWNNKNWNMHLIDGVGHQFFSPDLEGGNGQIRIQNSTGNLFSLVYSEPVGGTIIQIDNTPYIAQSRYADNNQIIGGFWGGSATWDVNILGGNQTIISGIRYGTGNINIAAGATYTQIFPGMGEPNVTDASSYTRNYSLFKIAGPTNLYPFSTTAVPVKTKPGCVTLSGATQDATVAVNEADTNYHVHVDNWNASAGASLGVPWAQVSDATHVALHTTVAPGSGNTVQLCYWIWR